MFAPLGHEQTMIDVEAERAFLAALEGGCQVPIGALATTAGARRMLYGFIGDIAGKRLVRGEIVLDTGKPQVSGVRLANELRSRGASEILEGLRRAEHVPSPQPE